MISYQMLLVNIPQRSCAIASSSAFLRSSLFLLLLLRREQTAARRFLHLVDEDRLRLHTVNDVKQQGKRHYYFYYFVSILIATASVTITVIAAIVTAM